METFTNLLNICSTFQFPFVERLLNDFFIMYCIIIIYNNILLNLKYKGRVPPNSILFNKNSLIV